MAENQRVRLSKQLLRQSLIDLLHDQSIHKISVREICDRAQVNRSTFYKYYGSQYDLFKEMEDEILEHINHHLSAEPTTMAGDLPHITKLVAFVGDNAPLCRILINHNVDPTFPDALISLSYLRQWIDTQFAAVYSKSEMEYVYGLVVNGGYSIIKTWINKDDREPPEFIAALLCTTIAKLFPANTGNECTISAEGKE
ncbi:MAG TPA: TetR/AcrR family transcriptional regulator [Candidatus Limiplasma sp.]|nr:TetR/AcrR family transcriptional regulator [Candidatus Limiplasma sp.]